MVGIIMVDCSLAKEVDVDAKRTSSNELLILTINTSPIGAHYLLISG